MSGILLPQTPSFSELMANQRISSQNMIGSHFSDSFVSHGGGGGRVTSSAAGSSAAGSSGSSSDDEWSKYWDKVSQSVDNWINSYTTSALKETAEEAERVRAYNAEQARLSREFSATEAQKERLFQASREDSAYQRLISDLKAAGLNPILAYGQGGSVSPTTGSYAMPSSTSASASQANYASAKNADKFDFEDLVPVMLLPLMQSVVDTVKDGISGLKDGIKFSLF